MAAEPSSKANTETPVKAKTEAEPQATTPSKAETKAKAKATTAGEPAGKAAAAVGKAASKGTDGQAARTPAPLEVEHALSAGPFGQWIRGAIRQTPSWLVSMVIHVVVLLVLALVTLPPSVIDEARQLIVSPDEEAQLEEIEELDPEPPEQLDVVDFQVANIVFDAPAKQEFLDPSPFDDLTAAPLSVNLSDIGLEHAPKSDLLNVVGKLSGSDLEGRGSGKDRWRREGGGTEASEQAVALALKWLAEHQLADGGWNFDHTRCPRCRGQCRNPGNLPDARNGATGLALLPFLGAGQTHRTGKYKDQVKAGLYFLINNMKVSLQQGGSLYEPGGSMYSHGICSIALCEAYAMTHDKGLYAPAQQALNFIAYAQDPIGGGWRYQPQQRGDTSVVGWQIMAMKSGHMAYLRVLPTTVQKAFRFLDSVQANNGAHYGYTDPAAGRPATTAVGLLCRMYLGWKKDNPALQRGVKWMSDKGPDKTNMYYNYYATQVMRHWEGDLWKKWNATMRDQMVSSQAKKGHEKGSWFMGAGHVSDRGGRLYCTAMATMVLEVYYRHLPIYRKQSTEEEFPLD